METIKTKYGELTEWQKIEDMAIYFAVLTALRGFFQNELRA